MVLMPFSPFHWHAAEPINAVLGDVSFISKYKRAPGPADSEPTRIKTHLAYMLESLRAKDVSGMDAGPSKNRQFLLEVLKDYAEEGQFPENVETLARTPIFIDGAGIPCAVANLMQKSGYSDLAARVDSDFHRAYLQELCNGRSEVSYEINTWAQNHGFDLDELAQIQPGYSPKDLASLCFLMCLILALGLNCVFALPLGFLAAMNLWPCPATAQFICGLMNAVICGFATLLAMNLDSGKSQCQAFSKRCLGRVVAICSLLGLANTLASTVVVSTPVCHASKFATVASWVLCGIPVFVILQSLVYLGLVSICSPKRKPSRRRRLPKTFEHPQQALHHQGWHAPQWSLGPVQSPVMQHAHAVPQQCFFGPAGFTPMAYTSVPVHHARANVPMAPVSDRFLPRVTYAPPMMLKTVSFSTSKAFGFEDPYARLALDSASTDAGSDEVLDDIGSSDSE